MPGTAARRDSGGDVTEQAARALAREAIQVRDARGLEVRFAGLGGRRPSEAVEGKEHDLRVVGDDERLEEIEHLALASVLSVPMFPNVADHGISRRGGVARAGLRGTDALVRSKGKHSLC